MKTRRSALWALLVLGLAAVAVLLPIEDVWQLRHQPAAHPGAVSFGVLGDSDSHAYHDELKFADNPAARGGALRQRTWQWTEVLAHLRADQLDPGPWGVWGTRFRRLSVLRDALGLDGRFPVKQDYLFNQAYSGAVCDNLNGTQTDQTGRLLTAMRRAPERWQNGIVLIRIGTNDFGKQDSLEDLSRSPDAAEPVALMDACLREIRTTVQRLRAPYPGLRIVLVGIFNNAEWEKFHALWQTPQAQANIHQGLTRFDQGLRAIAQGDPHTLFLDDQAWFAALWGSRMPSGKPVYKTVRFGERFEVRNTGGDEPHNATLRDGHAGTVWNALWAQSLVAQLNAHFGLSIKPLQTDELVHFVDPDGHFGMR
jgi:hypothetical protein